MTAAATRQIIPHPSRGESRSGHKAIHQPIIQTDIQADGVRFLARGKVRDIYEVGEHLLIVATDRLSAFDVVLPTPIPEKGRVLTQISCFWFEMMKDVIPNHVVATEVDDFPSSLHRFRSQLEGRSMLCRRADVFPAECVARGYIIGSGWKDYQSTGAICGIELPAGLRMADRLPEPIFTPATKAEQGEHDENISIERMSEIVGRETAERLRAVTLEIYTRAAEYARGRGIIIADTKFEFGRAGDEIIIVDECLTPDSSRFWPADTYSPGSSPASYDKQFVRDYLETLDWNKKSPGPELPFDVVLKTSEKYLEAFSALTGNALGM